MSRIVITSCSKRKICDEGLLPAIRRYDGPGFRVLRRYLREQIDPLDVFILSARFGLLSHTTEIPFYEQPLNKESICSLAVRASKQAPALLASVHEPNRVFVNLGHAYLQALEPVLLSLPADSSITFATGPSGRRLSELHDWLYGDSSCRDLKVRLSEASAVRFKGVLVTANETSIRSLIDDAVESGGTASMQRVQTWFVPFRHLKISPKWLVSRLTGIPVSKFHSDQARRLLRDLGIEVQRL